MNANCGFVAVRRWLINLAKLLESVLQLLEILVQAFDVSIIKTLNLILKHHLLAVTKVDGNAIATGTATASDAVQVAFYVARLAELRSSNFGFTRTWSRRWRSRSCGGVLLRGCSMLTLTMDKRELVIDHQSDLVRFLNIEWRNSKKYKSVSETIS